MSGTVISLLKTLSHLPAVYPALKLVLIDQFVSAERQRPPSSELLVDAMLQQVNGVLQVW